MSTDRLQRALTWSLRSPRNYRRTRNAVVGFFAAVTVVGVLAAGAGAVKILAGSRHAAQLAATQPAQTQPGLAPLAERRPEPAREVPADLAPIQRQVAGFVTAWLAAPSMPHGAWLAKVKPYAVPEVYPYLLLTDAVAVPRTTLAGVTVNQALDSDATATARLVDGSSIRVTLQSDGKAWLVTGYEEA